MCYSHKGLVVKPASIVSRNSKDCNSVCWLRYIGNTWTMDFSKFPFNILHRGKIDKRLMRAVEVIFNKPSRYLQLSSIF